jgi:hypothetical protein
MQKPKSTAKLLNLPEDQQAQIADWMLSGLPYHAVQHQIQKEFNLAVSFNCLTKFWNAVCSPALLLRRRRAAGLADDVATEAEKQPGRFDAATIDALKQRAFELAVAPQSNPADVKALFGLVLEARGQDLKQQDVAIKLRRLEVIERQAAEAKSKLEGLKTKGGLAPETLAKVEEALALL